MDNKVIYEDVKFKVYVINSTYGFIRVINKLSGDKFTITRKILELILKSFEEYKTKVEQSDNK